MSVNYVAVQWNRQKRLYDFTLAGGVLLFLGSFVGVSKALFPLMTDEILLLRAFGAGAFSLLHVILCIGPLCRLDPRFLPLLYNRRHAGVTCFLLGLIHAVLVIITYHAGGDTNPIVSIFTSTPLRASPDSLPFQAFGFVSLFILFLMAATSHDFWLANLTAPVWKALHMAVYGAYGLLVLHVTFGVLQAETSPVMAVSTAAGFVMVIGLHLFAGAKERASDGPLVNRKSTVGSELSSPSPWPSPSGRGGDHRQASACPQTLGVRAGDTCASLSIGERAGVRGKEAADNRQRHELLKDEVAFVDACSVADIPENRARIVCLSGERVAIFKYDGKISVVSNVCQHQNGPLGEGKILEGCITCPWHGYQYQPEDGASPAPFTEKVPTFRVQVRDGRVFVDPNPLPAGTRVEPALLSCASRREDAPTPI
jgi:nitrite reductase/ring-hydroxylating ferredoxin subunit/DMSO/TMAO reductase YedYZ heme-binding membrane subunit